LGAAQLLQTGQEQVGVELGAAHPCVSKAGDRTFRRTAVTSEYSRAIHDEFVNMFGREDCARNEGHCKKIWRIQKERKGKSGLRERGKKKGESTQMCNLETNGLLAKEVTNK
jgi:hypothetical protein